jgi:hypothetical protein
LNKSSVRFAARACPSARAFDVHFGRFSPPSPPQENRMPAWKVLFTLVLACACLGLAFAALIVPMTLTAGGERWVWLTGLLGATAVLGSLFALFLRRASASMEYRRR